VIGDISAEGAVRRHREAFGTGTTRDEHGVAANLLTARLEPPRRQVGPAHGVIQPDRLSEPCGGRLEPGLKGSPIAVPTGGHVTHWMGDLDHLAAKDGARFQQDNIKLNVLAFEGGIYSGGATPHDHHIVLALGHIAVQMYRVRGPWSSHSADSFVITR
jgi:hypothetical protein